MGSAHYCFNTCGPSSLLDIEATQIEMFAALKVILRNQESLNKQNFSPSFLLPSLPLVPLSYSISKAGHIYLRLSSNPPCS